MRRFVSIAFAMAVALPSAANAASSVTIALDDAPAVQHALVVGNALQGLSTDIPTIYLAENGPQREPIENLSPVPEPASWAMMLAGFAVIGSLSRSRSRRQIASFA